MVLMMASKPSCGAVLGGHHRCVVPRTMTGIIRTTTPITAPCKNDAEAGRSFEMATVSIMSRHEDNRMGAWKSISQINSFIIINKQELCNNPPLPHQERVLRTRQAIFHSLGTSKSLSRSSCQAVRSERAGHKWGGTQMFLLWAEGLRGWPLRSRYAGGAFE